MATQEAVLPLTSLPSEGQAADPQGHEAKRRRIEYKQLLTGCLFLAPVWHPEQLLLPALLQYHGEQDLETVMQLVDNELSEPYSIFTYRYFLHIWPELAFLAYDSGHCLATVVCKMDRHKCTNMMRGYLAMLVVEKPYRALGVGTELVKRAIDQMVVGGCEEVVLEAEVTNTGALALYQNLGFIRGKRLHKYYLNGQDAYRLKLLLPLTPDQKEKRAAQQLAELSLHGGDCSCPHHGPGAPHEHAEHLPGAPPGVLGSSKSPAKDDAMDSSQIAAQPEP